MFALEARTYIEKLIRIQKKLKKLGYERDDQEIVSECVDKLSKLLEFYPCRTNSIMMQFWINHRAAIRYLVPTNNYKGFKNLMDEFTRLDKQSQVIELQLKINRNGKNE